jgi:hypothetical protein
MHWAGRETLVALLLTKSMVVFHTSKQNTSKCGVWHPNNTQRTTGLASFVLDMSLTCSPSILLTDRVWIRLLVCARGFQQDFAINVLRAWIWVPRRSSGALLLRCHGAGALAFSGLCCILSPLGAQMPRQYWGICDFASIYLLLTASNRSEYL